MECPPPTGHNYVCVYQGWGQIHEYLYLNTFFLSICICICILRFQGGSICICISNTYKIILFLPFSISCTTQKSPFPSSRRKSPCFYEIKYPALAKLVPLYLCIPASFAPVERLFSIAGKVFRPDRCRLKDKTFEELMFIRCNQHRNAEISLCSSKGSLVYFKYFLGK